MNKTKNQKTKKPKNQKTKKPKNQKTKKKKKNLENGMTLAYLSGLIGERRCDCILSNCFLVDVYQIRHLALDFIERQLAKTIKWCEVRISKVRQQASINIGISMLSTSTSRLPDLFSHCMSPSINLESFSKKTRERKRERERTKERKKKAVGVEGKETTNLRSLETGLVTRSRSRVSSGSSERSATGRSSSSPSLLSGSEETVWRSGVERSAKATRGKATVPAPADIGDAADWAWASLETVLGWRT
jgi:hypothetical protein